jgi:hypothetical protein
MPDEHTNGVRVTNQQIYDKLVDVDKRLAGIEVTVEKVIVPTQTSQGLRIDRLELRVYAITAGLLAAAGIGKGIGLL